MTRLISALRNADKSSKRRKLTVFWIVLLFNVEIFNYLAVMNKTAFHSTEEWKRRIWRRRKTWEVAIKTTKLCTRHNLIAVFIHKRKKKQNLISYLFPLAIVNSILVVVIQASSTILKISFSFSLLSLFILILVFRKCEISTAKKLFFSICFFFSFHLKVYLFFNVPL